MFPVQWDRWASRAAAGAGRGRPGDGHALLRRQVAREGNLTGQLHLL